MNSNCNFFFLTATAVEIWASKDAVSENKMFECLYTCEKQGFFSRVIFQNGLIHEKILTELAENAFVSAWEDFSKSGRMGRLDIKSPVYTGFFFIIFKNKYLRLLEKENRIAGEKLSFGSLQSASVNADTDNRHAFSWKTQHAFNQVSPGCRELLQWKHIDNLEYDEIALRRNISRKSATNMVSRCGKEFLGYYQNNRN